MKRLRRFSVSNANLSWTKWNLERTWLKDETHEYSWNIFMNPPNPLKHVVILWQWSREATGLYEKTCWQKQLQSSAIVRAALLRGEEDAKPIPPTRRYDTLRYHIPIIPLPDGHDIPWHAVPCDDGMIYRPRYGPNEFTTCSMRRMMLQAGYALFIIVLYVCQVEGFRAVHTLLNIFPSPLCDAKILGRQSCIWKDEAVNVR